MQSKSRRERFAELTSGLEPESPLPVLAFAYPDPGGEIIPLLILGGASMLSHLGLR